MTTLLDSHIKKRPHYKKMPTGDVYCHPCEKLIKIGGTSIKHRLDSHEQCSGHKKLHNRWQDKIQKQNSVAEMFESTSRKWMLGLARMFTSCNIPIWKANCEEWKKFTLDWCGKLSPDESHLRKVTIDPVYMQVIDEIRFAIGLKWIYLQVDEAQIQSRRIVSVIVGPLDGKENRPYCLNTVELVRPPDSALIQQVIQDSLAILYPQNILYDNVRILSTDQAAYNIKASNNMKAGLYPHLRHITCVCHALSRVCEAIHDRYKWAKKVVNLFIQSIDVCSRRARVIEIKVMEKLPNKPVITRWGSWVVYCLFIHKHLGQLRESLEIFRDEVDESPKLGRLLDIIKTYEVQVELREIFSMSSIITTIEKLEKRNLTIYEAKRLVDTQREKLLDPFKEKLDQCLKKNPDYEKFFEDEETMADNNYLYSPITSVDVERSFSQFKHVLTDQRTNLTEENFRKLAIIYYHRSNK